MVRVLFGVAACTAFAGMAFAVEPIACDEAAFAMVMAEVEGATAADKKALAMQELEMAKTALTQDKPAECSMHLGMASEAVRPQ